MKVSGLSILFAAIIGTLFFAFSNCGGGGGGSADGTSYYANWACGGSGQCATVMGGADGSQGPFSSYNDCFNWCQVYIPGNCSCSGSGGSGGTGGTSPAGAPTISSISPTVVNSNTDITVMGSNFPSTLTDTSINVNGITITPVSVLN